MGNCQAIDSATLVIQHPCGRVDRLYWPVTASEVMKMNPGHYVALLIITTLCPSNHANNHPTTTTTTTNNNNNSVRFTRVKILRPTDTLVLGRVYRLLTAEDVMKGLWAKKYAKMKKIQSESADKPERVKEKPGLGFETNQVIKHGRQQRPTTSTNSATARSRTWQPSLHSISEAGS